MDVFHHVKLMELVEFAGNSGNLSIETPLFALLMKKLIYTFGFPSAAVNLIELCFCSAADLFRGLSIVLWQNKKVMPPFKTGWFLECCKIILYEANKLVI